MTKKKMDDIVEEVVVDLLDSSRYFGTGMTKEKQGMTNEKARIQ